LLDGFNFEEVECTEFDILELKPTIEGPMEEILESFDDLSSEYHKFQYYEKKVGTTKAIIIKKERNW